MAHAHDNSSVSPVARAFVEARERGRPLPVWPGSEPDSLAAAYAVQDDAIALWSDRIAGWKLGRVPPPWDARFGAGRLAGPIFAAQVREAAEATFPVIVGGFAAVEAEYVLVMGADAPDGDGWTAETVADLVADARIGIEIAGSPFPGINDHGPAVTASDFGNNQGLILGPSIPDWRDRLNGLTCRMEIDGGEVGRGGAAMVPGGPLDSLAFLLNLLHTRGRVLEAGQLVSTGAATGVHRIYAGQACLADFGPDGSLAARAVAWGTDG
ncbi:MAG: 2-keto-4-pentenoate hydratase [Alphaproteobacteria bacterium]|nr:2-keto-4-pentenoate hydratase [Alphaproteobacteria bacterium]MBU1526244.1 2-keto-4-pentenoate hydratase [Alphaproteobacteria bacterium]MBU2116655.1 2-keto-4-pentenoate hydratase [Alphaproteobacteria bacterium]MBU2351401.1 2-keto-4-pentenoate hydratase [Alphaproteobacteria bacterium]MBU2382077.1 2-keto-4-pentenoate hydratase [Alphaproteobacteria bacterium]